MSHYPPLPGYACGRRIGGGPTCHVYLARNGRGQTVAVKVLKPRSEHDRFAVDLFRNEVRTGLALTHPNVIRVIESHVSNSPYFFVMEYVPGNSVKNEIDRHGPFNLSSTFSILRQVSEGLVELHRNGFIHGDVKPSNIMLPAPGRAKLIDLGFAHRPGEITARVDRSHVFGTANYLAPELSTRPLFDSEAADLFSLGVTAFEMLTGTVPYPGRSTSDVISNRSTCKPAVLPSSFAPVVRRMIESLTNPIPAQRPSARRLVHELARLQIAEMRHAA